MYRIGWDPRRQNKRQSCHSKWLIEECWVMKRPCEDMGLWGDQSRRCPGPIMVENGTPGGRGVRRCSGSPGEPWGGQQMLWQPRGVLGLVERGSWRSSELQGRVVIAPTEAWREGVQAILPPSWTSALSSWPCPVPASPGGTAWKPGEAVRGERWWWGGGGDREADGEGRREDLAEEGSPAQSPPRFPYLSISFILALCLWYLR